VVFLLAITLQDSYICLVATINNFVGKMRKIIVVFHDSDVVFVQEYTYGLAHFGYNFARLLFISSGNNP
jgi:hypothetical protein